jgi:hypothetical protein
MGLNANGALEFAKDSAGLREAVPAFSAGEGRSERYSRRKEATRFLGLPSPDRPFGLWISGRNIGQWWMRSGDSADIWETAVPTNAVDQLAGYENLTHLWLWGTMFQSHTVEGLAELKALTHLDLWGTWVSGPGLKHLAGLQKLRHLYLAGAPVPGAWLKYLAGLEGLTDLVADAAMVVDADLRRVAGIKNLARFALRRSNRIIAPYESAPHVSDEGLKHLAGLKQLTRVELGSHKVTPAGVKEFQKALPKCEVVLEGKGPDVR